MPRRCRRPCCSAAVTPAFAEPSAELGRRREEGRPAHHHRAAARLVRLRRADRRLQGASTASTVNELNPDAGSGDELEAIKANKGNTGPQAPDVIDVGLSSARPPRTTACSSPTRSRPGTRSPTSAKDPDGYWYGDYYGVLAFEVNTDIVKNVPTGLGRSSRPTNMPTPLALAGDPRTSNQAIQAVYAAGLSPPRATPPRPRPRPASKFFARAQQEGQLRAGDRQGGLGRAGRDPDRRALGLQRSRRPRHAEGQPEGRGRGARQTASSPASMSRRSAPTRRIRTRPSCGWSISTPTKASSAG